MKTVAEIRDDLKTLKEDIFRSGEAVDMKLLASYVDRLLMSVDDICTSIESMEAEVDTMCKCCEMEMPMEKPKAARKPARKSKPAKKKKRR
jgi:hypothetical protein